MNGFWVVIELSATLFEAIILFSFFNSFLKQASCLRWVYLALPVLHTIFVSILNWSNFDQMLTALLTLIFSCVLVIVFYQGNLLIRIGLTIAFYAIWMASELGVLTILSALFKNFMVNLQEPSIERITAIVMSKLAIFIILKVVQQFSMTQRFRLPFKKSLPLYILPMITILIIISMQLFWTNEPTNTRFMFAGISLIGLLFANFIVFDQYRRFIHEAEMISQIAQIRQNQAAQVEQVEMMTIKDQEIRKIAHDLKNQLLPSVLYLQQGKGEQSLKNLEQLVETLNDIQKAPEITGHALIDLILTYKGTKAQSQGIKINVDSRLSDPIYIPDTDISVILGNTLDNAIEAAAKIEDKNKKMIDVKVRSGRGLLTITIVNPVDHEVSIQDGKIKTSKTEVKDHGIGLDSVRALVYKNNGYLNLQSENLTFTLSISLKNLPLDA